MKWKLKGKMLYSLSNAFLSIRGQLNGFFFSLRISGILILFGYYLWQFFKNKKIKMLFAILITKFQKKSNKKKNALNLRPVTLVNASGRFYLIWTLKWGQTKVENYSFSQFIILFVYEIGNSSYFLSCCRHTSGTVGEREIVTLASCQRFKMRPGREYERARHWRKLHGSCFNSATKINDQIIFYCPMLGYNLFITFLIF